MLDKQSKYIMITAAIACGYIIGLIGCTPAQFSSPEAKSQGSAVNTSTEASERLETTGPSDAPAADTSPPESAGQCDYPQYTGALNSPAASECHSTSRPAAASSDRRNDGGTFILSMYNASNLSHGLTPAPNRAITFQKVAIAAGLAENSVDLVLYSYEPVRWEIYGNTAAVRSVHVRGYHCALVEGVAAAKVSIATYEQGTSDNAGRLPLSLNILKDESVYEGSCLANQTFIVE